MKNIISTVSLYFFICTFIICFLDLMVMGLKWNILLRAFNVRVRFDKPVIAYLTGKVFSFFTPSTIGIDTYKSFFLKKHGAPLMPVVSSIFVERFVGMLSSLAFISLLLPLAIEGFHLSHKKIFMTGGWSLFIAILVGLYLVLTNIDRIPHRINIPYLPNKLRELLRNFLRGISYLRENKEYVLYYFTVSTCEKLMYGTCIFVSAKAIGLDISYLYIVSAAPLIALLERLPISFSSFGIREGFFVVFFNRLGIDSTISISIALIIRAAEMCIVILSLFLWYGIGYSRSMKQEISAVEHEVVAIRSKNDN